MVFKIQLFYNTYQNPWSVKLKCASKSDHSLRKFLWQVCQKLESVIYSQLFLRFTTSTPHTSSEILGWESCLFLYLAKTSTALLSRGTSWNLQVSAISPRQLPTCHRCTRQEQWEGENHELLWAWVLGLHPKCSTLVPASVRENLLLVMGRGEGAGPTCCLQDIWVSNYKQL